MDLIYPSSTSFLGSSHYSSRKFQLISLTLVASAAAMSITSIVLSVTFLENSRSLIDGGHRFEGQGPSTTGSSMVCLPCSAILDSSSTMEDRVMSEFFFEGRRFDSNSEENDGGGWTSADEDTCCAKGKRHLRLLLTMFLKVRSRQDRVKGADERKRCLVFPSVENSVNGTRCVFDKREAAEAAHLTGARPASIADETLAWPTPNVLQGRLDNMNGRLTCRMGGVYFVYSQVYFVEYTDDVMTDGNRRTTAGDANISVYINRFVNQTRKTEGLTQRSEGLCPRSILTAQSICEYTIYAGSLVELAAGDSIYVTVSHPDLVNGDAKVTYFGLQKVT